MIKQLAENKWFVRMGTGFNTNDYIVNGQDNTVCKSKLTSEEIAGLPDAEPDTFISGTALNAVLLHEERVHDLQELKLLAAHLDFRALLGQ